MKIACLINSLTTGGAERQFVQLVEYLSQKHQVSLYTIEKDYEITTTVPIKRLSTLSLRTSSFRKMLNSPLLKRRFVVELTKEQPDLIISFLERSNFLAIRAGKKLGIPVIVSLRCYPTAQYGKGLYGAIFRHFIRKLYPEATLVLVNSKASKHELVKHYSIPPSQIRVLYNWIDIRSIRKKAEERLSQTERQLFSKDGKIIIALGRLTEAKGFWHLIRAFKQVGVPGARLLIIGEGEERSYLERLITKLGLKGKVILTGRKENPFKLMARADLFVMSSLWEGFPNALLEAMTLGLPVISTDCLSGPGEILTSKSYGVLTPRLDGVRRVNEPLTPAEQALADAMKKLLLDEKRRALLAAKGTRRAEEFAKERQLHKFQHLLSKAWRDSHE